MARVNDERIEALTITCTRCAAEQDSRLTRKEELRLPRGWKRLNGEPICQKCWNAHYVLRAITIPVAHPVNCTREEFREVLSQCWAAGTALANWTVRELLQADVVRTPQMERLPKMERRYLYPAARAAVPEIDPQTTTAMLVAVEKRWRKARYDVIWRRAASPPSYRYPTPYPINNQAWSMEIDEAGALILSARLGGERRRLRLRGGSGFWRQRRAVEALIRGEAHKGELAIYQRGGEVMAKMVMWLPRKTPRTQQKRGTLHVRTSQDSFLAYHMEGSDRIQYLHADHVRRWVAQHRRRLDRLADDTKAERRRPRKNMRGIQAQRNAWVGKHRARMHTWTHEVSRVIAGYAERTSVAKVLWDDRVRSYLPDAPYADIRTKLAYKLDEAGVELEAMESENGEVADKS